MRSNYHVFRLFVDWFVGHQNEHDHESLTTWRERKERKKKNKGADGG